MLDPSVTFFFDYSFLPTLGSNTLTPISDQDRISPSNINTISSRQVMRTKKNNPWGDYSSIQNQILLNNITIILVEQLLGIVARALKFSLKEWGSRSCQSICSVLEQSTFLSFGISPPQSINKYWPSVRRRGEPSLVGLALHSSGVKIVQVTAVEIEIISGQITLWPLGTIPTCTLKWMLEVLRT